MFALAMLALLAACAGRASALTLPFFYSTNDWIPIGSTLQNDPGDGAIDYGAIDVDSLTSVDNPVALPNTYVAPPGPGSPPVTSFFDVFVELDLAGPGGEFSGTGTGSATLFSTINPTVFFCELASLDLTVGPYLIRESPTQSSFGQTTIVPVAGGYNIDSFFDVFTEISIDGGQNWTPSNGTTTFIISPEPTSLAGLAGVSLLLLRPRRQSK